MASIHHDPRYDNLRADITTHTGKQLQLTTPTMDKNLGLVCANVEEYLAKNHPNFRDPQVVFGQVAVTLHRLLSILQQSTVTPTDAPVSTLGLLRAHINSKDAKSAVTMQRAADQFEVCFGKRAENPPIFFNYMHMREFIASLIQRGYAPGTVIARFSVLRDFFSEMLVRKLCFEDPTEGVQLSTKERRMQSRHETLPLEEEEVTLIFQAIARANKLQLAGTLIVRECCSIRPHQVARLQWRHYCRGGDGYGLEVAGSKGGVAKRIPATQQVVDFLAAWREKCPNTGPEDPIFPEYYDADPSKFASKVQKMSNEFHAAMDAAGIDRVKCEKVLPPGATDERKAKRSIYGKRAYSLRHMTFARVAPMFGLAVAKEFLQHRQVSTTLHYAKAQQSQLCEARDHLNTTVKGSLAEFDRVQAEMRSSTGQVSATVAELRPHRKAADSLKGIPVDSVAAYSELLDTWDFEPTASARLAEFAHDRLLGIPADSIDFYCAMLDEHNCSPELN